MDRDEQIRVIRDRIVKSILPPHEFDAWQTQQRIKDGLRNGIRKKDMFVVIKGDKD